VDRRARAPHARSKQSGGNTSTPGTMGLIRDGRVDRGPSRPPLPGLGARFTVALGDRAGDGRRARLPLTGAEPRLRLYAHGEMSNAAHRILVTT
jgi:hypothetical protein